MSPSAENVYRARRAAIAAQAGGPHHGPKTIVYSTDEDHTWNVAYTALARRWKTLAPPEIGFAAVDLGLPSDRVPQLSEVTAALQPLTGFNFRAVAGLVPVGQFFSALAVGNFLSTQYVRHHSSPLYTPEPDVIHEVLGHATCLANPDLAELHRLAGQAMMRLETEPAKQFVADVFWFSAEFGVLDGDGTGPLAYGAGILSSVGELDSFRAAEIRPLDIAHMGTTEYQIDSFQPVLYAAHSLSHVLDEVGGFFATASDESVDRLVAVTGSKSIGWSVG